MRLLLVLLMASACGVLLGLCVWTALLGCSWLSFGLFAAFIGFQAAAWTVWGRLLR